MDNDQLRARLRAEIASQKLSQIQLAEQIGVRRSTIWDLTNHRTLVNENALALLDALGLELTITKKAGA